MRILFLTQWFQPEPFFKGLPFAKALREKGHDVEVLTGFPNYPGGKLYPGYRVRLYRREVMDGIPVHRVALYPSHDKSALRRILNYLSFAFSAFLIGPWLVRKPDVVYVYNLVTLGPCAFLLRWIFGSKVLIDVQDLWPESVTHSNMLRNSIALKLLNEICNGIYRRADRLTVLSPGFRELLRGRGVSPDKMDVVYNWCDESGMVNGRGPARGEKSPEFEGKFVVLFAGTMGLAQGLDTLLDCASLTRDLLPPVQFVLIGGGVERARLLRRAEEMGLDNVTFLPPRPLEAMGEIFSLSDALIVHLKDEPLFRATIPSKTQAYLFIGKPIVMALRGDAADLVRDAGAGVLCDSENPSQMADAIKIIYKLSANERQQMGEAGHRYYMEHLSFQQGVMNFEKIMISMLERAA